MALFDVDGETIGVATFAERGAAAAAEFYPIADAFIETLHFEAPDAIDPGQPMSDATG